ncbi:MAG: RagB/SusD family nutrient uptake outer membrane protein [Bacteroidota bacterium]
MKNNSLTKIVVYLLFSFPLVSCKKEWLDAKPDQSLVVPSTLKDLQSSLDNTLIFNVAGPNLGELGCDDYYLTSTTFQTRSDIDRNTYSWASGDVYGTSKLDSWENPYKQIYYANNTLEGISKIEKDEFNEPAWNNIKGSALFYRAWAFYNLSQIFCKPYSTTTASTDLGIILRTESDINIPSTRSTVQETYNSVIEALKHAKDLLPINPLYITRPSKKSAFALLARTYLLMENYDSALVYADACLQFANTTNQLINFDNVDITPVNPFLYSSNSEIIF